MNRGPTGRFEITSTGGERARAFVPNPLPPMPPIRLDGPVQRSLEPALLALGRLDGVAALLPDTALFLYTYVRKEAVLSSQIEGTQSSISDLLLYELNEAPGAPIDDVQEVSSYVAALDHGIARLKDGFPLSTRLIREVHSELLSHSRGSTKNPGDFRRSQNWIGGTHPGNATFVPPPPHLVLDCMSELEKFLNEDTQSMPALVRAGLAHVQFETIHPFLDGNGRVGRLLITLFLCQAGTLRQPLLYLSLYLKQHRTRYYELLDIVRRDGDWESWLVFFLEGIHQTAENAVSTAQQLAAVFEADRKRIEQLGKRTGSALRVHDALKSRPLSSIQEIRSQTGLSHPGATAGITTLVELGIATEITAQRRRRVYAYRRYLDLLNEED